ncbi:MAG: DsbE family thiol:disulfide interchange protein [Alphaproteobacteria bacterium]|nr:DsbE family thiol:disulfide interchange protein [Alphaproteobacteria bacterium]
MKRLVFLAPLLLFAGLVGWFVAGMDRERQLPSMLIDRPAPAVTLPPLLTDRPGLDPAALAAGRPQLVNLFASWCAPCRVEHPTFMALAREGVPILGINYKDRPEDAIRWLEQLGNPYARIGTDRDGRAGIDWGITGVPETFLLDAQGRVRWRHVGPLMPEHVPSLRQALAMAARG